MIHRHSTSRNIKTMISGALRSASLVLLASCAVVTAGNAVAPANAGIKVTSTDAREQLKLGLNKSVIITLPGDAYDILVANPAVADAVTRTSRRIYLFGKSVGQTNIFVFGPNGEQIASIDLNVERDVAGLEQYIKRFIPESDIQVELINDNVVLTGTVETPLDAKRAADLANLFVSGGEATTGQYATTASAPTDGGGVSISDPDATRRTSKIVNLIKIMGEDQVTLKVTVAEVSRAVMKQLGVATMVSGSSNGISWNSISTKAMGLGAEAAGGQTALVTSALQSYFDAMEQSGVMKTLAEPTLTAVSGEQASFKVGGEFNVLTAAERSTSGALEPREGGALSYTQIEYGIGLDFKPIVLSPGRISLKIRTSVSEPTAEASGHTSSGRTVYNLPSIRKRLADTTVELPSGGSMMIAGLVRDDVRQVVQGLPGASKIPILGTMFRSRSFVRNESELVIIVTPFITRPTSRNALARPDDNFNPTSDGAANFLGRVNRVYGTMKTNKPNGRYHGAVGFIYK